MISISTIITYYKSKYSAIGRIGDETGEDPAEAADVSLSSIALLEKYSEKLLTFNTINTKRNAGLAASITQQTTLNTQIGDTVKKMTFLEEREKNLIKTFQVGTATLMHRTQMYGNMQTALRATSEDMVKYRSILEETSTFGGKKLAELASTIEGMPDFTGKTPEQIADAKAKRFDSMGKYQQYLESETAAMQWIDKNTTLSSEQTEALKLYSAGQDKTLSKTVMNITALAGAYKDVEDPVKLQNSILSDIANTAADVRAQYSKMPMGLEKAVLKARQLGVSMDQVHKIGEGLLDIESSVGKELEYQLLSGQRLVKNGKSLTNAYREATLMGDADKSIDALNDILDSQKNVLDGTNMYAKKALADQMGISTKELQMMHEKRKLQEQIKNEAGIDVDFDTMKEEDKEKLKIELEKTDSELAKTMVKIADKERAMETPADTAVRLLTEIKERGLLIRKDKYDEKETETQRKAAYTDSFQYMYKAEKQNLPWRENANINEQGDLTIKTDARKLITTNVEALTKALPVIGDAFGTLVNKLKTYTDKLTGSPIEVTSIPYINATNVTVKKGGDGDFARGGLLDGPSHAQGGIPTAFGELEGGEAVINKRSTQKFMPLLSSINEAGGGRSFAKGGVLNTKDSGDVNKQLMVLIDKIANMKTADTPNINTNEIIAAITRAMGSVKFDVNVSVDPLDPLKFKKEIEFRSGNLNSVSYK